MTKPTTHEVRDSLVDDAMDSAGAAGRLLDARAVSEYIEGVLQKLDRKRSEAPAKSTTCSAVKDESRVAKEFQRRSGRELDPSWKVDRGPQKQRRVIPREEILFGMKIRLGRRMQWIKQRPELFERVKGISVALNSSKPEIREKAALKMREFLKETDRLAGYDWRSGPPEKLHFG